MAREESVCQFKSSAVIDVLRAMVPRLGLCCYPRKHNVSVLAASKVMHALRNETFGKQF